MTAEQRVSTIEGPRRETERYAEHIDSTVVKGAEEIFFVSTIRKEPGFHNPTSRTQYETLVFPVPQGVDVKLDEAGEPEFTKKFELRETNHPDLYPYNQRSMTTRYQARIVHTTAVKKVVEVIKK